jgi:drug/metabolite transporter (DMT)-like permease
MSSSAILLVLLAAGLHAAWNFIAKRAAGGTPFVWLFNVCSATLYAPVVVALMLLNPPRLGIAELAFLFGSALLHLLYFLLLNWGYQEGDLSLVYPMARGTGPMLAACGAILLFGERPSPLALGGALAIGVSVVALAGNPSRIRHNHASRAVAYALLTGLSIAAYTLWDKVAVSDLMITPIVVVWISQVHRIAMLSPFAYMRREAVREEWRRHARYVVAVAVLSPLTYVLVLTALVANPVSYVAPMREISTLIGTLLGSRLLMEGHTLRRGLAATGMMAGVVALALG